MGERSNRELLLISDTRAMNITVELTPDSHPRFWALYHQEPEDMRQNNSPIHLWVRRFTLYSNETYAKMSHEKIVGPITWEHHELFPELQIGYDSRGIRWLLEPVPLYVYNIDG